MEAPLRNGTSRWPGHAHNSAGPAKARPAQQLGEDRLGAGPAFETSLLGYSTGNGGRGRKQSKLKSLFTDHKRKTKLFFQIVPAQI